MRWQDSGPGAANPPSPTQLGRTRHLHWQAGYTRVNLDLCILLQNRDCTDHPALMLSNCQKWSLTATCGGKWLKWRHGKGKKLDLLLPVSGYRSEHICRWQYLCLEILLCRMHPLYSTPLLDPALSQWDYLLSLFYMTVVKIQKRKLKKFVLFLPFIQEGFWRDMKKRKGWLCAWQKSFLKHFWVLCRKWSVLMNLSFMFSLNSLNLYGL